MQYLTARLCLITHNINLTGFLFLDDNAIVNDTFSNNITFTSVIPDAYTITETDPTKAFINFCALSSKSI